MVRPALSFATPRKLPKAKNVEGRVVVLDLAFASEAGGGFDKITRPFIEGLGPRLAAWIDHHDHKMHAAYAADPRFVLATKQEHGACPEMITPDLVKRTGVVNTIVCHADFDGLCSAAKWLREGVEPYEGADADSRAIDTRIGTPSATGKRIDRALRANPRDFALYGTVVRHLSEGLADRALWTDIDEAARGLEAREQRASSLATRYQVFPVKGPHERIAFVDATSEHGAYDKTHLLLLGQERAKVAVLVDKDTLSLAAGFDSGFNFLDLLGLSGGMPTLVSVERARLTEALTRLGLAPNLVRELNDAVAP